MSRRAALIGTGACALGLLGWGALLGHGLPGSLLGAPAPVQIPVHVAVLNPSTGAMVWSSAPVPKPERVELNPATGNAVAQAGSVRAAASTSAR